MRSERMRPACFSFAALSVAAGRAIVAVATIAAVHCCTLASSGVSLKRHLPLQHKRTAVWQPLPANRARSGPEGPIYNSPRLAVLSAASRNSVGVGRSLRNVKRLPTNTRSLGVDTRLQLCFVIGS